MLTPSAGLPQRTPVTDETQHKQIMTYDLVLGTLHLFLLYSIIFLFVVTLFNKKTLTKQSEWIYLYKLVEVETMWRHLSIVQTKGQMTRILLNSSKYTLH